MGKIKTFLKRILPEGDYKYWNYRYIVERPALKKALGVKIGERQLQFPTKVAILFIGTQKYINFLPKYYETIKKKFLPNTKKDFFVYTDQVKYPFLSGKKDIFVYPIEHGIWPYSALRKYKFINKARNKLKGYSHIIFLDADMYINEIITEKEFFCHDKPLFSLQHPNFIGKIGQFDRNPRCMACVKKGEDLSTYWQSCIWGGKTKYVLPLIKELERRTDIDIKNDVVALWHDESHLNKYLVERKNLVHTYDPSYAYPEKRMIPHPFKKKIVHIIKKFGNKRELKLKTFLK